MNQRLNHQNKRKQAGDSDDLAHGMRGRNTLQPVRAKRFGDDDDDDCLFLSPDTDDETSRAERAKSTLDQTRRLGSATTSSSLFRNTLNGNASASQSIIALKTPPASDAWNQQKPVKIEQKDDINWTDNTRPQETVTIYVGRDNQKLTARRSMLSKSPILEAMITQDARLGEYIMRPQLLTINRSHFATMLEFMHAEEYQPLTMTAEDNTKYFQHSASEKRYSNDEYSAELVRQGQLYILAKQFNVAGFADKIHEKICEVDTSRYSLQSLLKIAGIVFNNDCVDHVDCSDVLEQWIIEKLAVSFREIMERERGLFWHIERQTTKQKLFSHVLDAVSETYKHLGGLPERGNRVVLD